MPSGPECGGISHAVVPGWRFSAIADEDTTPSGPRNVRIAGFAFTGWVDPDVDPEVSHPARTSARTRPRPIVRAETPCRRRVVSTEVGDGWASYVISMPDLENSSVP
jgi:hypothetical protein